MYFFEPHVIDLNRYYYGYSIKLQTEWPNTKHAKCWIFFSLGETFLGIGMRLGGGIMQFKMFGNLAHPSAPISHSTVEEVL